MYINSISNQPYKTQNLTFEVNKNSQLSQNYKKSKKRETIAPAVTTAAITSVIVITMMSKSSQQFVQKNFKKIKQFLEEKIDNSPNLDNKEKLYEYALNRVNSAIKKCESINNIVTYKDVLFMKLMYQTKVTKQIHDSISSFFEKISRKSVLNSYNNTKKEFEKMNQTYNMLDKEILKNSPNELITHKGKTYTKKELVEKARSHRKNVMNIINDFTSEDAINKRHERINDTTSNLYNAFWNSSIKGFWSKGKYKQKELWQTFIAAEQIKKDKAKIYKEVTDIRNSITYTKQDRTDLICSHTNMLNDIIPSNDKIGLNIVKRLEWLAEHSDGFQYNNNGFLQELKNLEKHISQNETDDILAKTQKESLKIHINNIKELVEYRGRGELQEMMALYYKAAPYELTKSHAASASKRAINSFDKAVNIENNDFFDKIRDLRLGSAPTDVLTILLSFITLSSGLCYAKDKDERTSIILRTGIPVTGGILVASYMTAKLVSGGKSLALGLLSGIILNQIGKITDIARKQVNETHNKSKDTFRTNTKNSVQRK